MPEPDGGPAFARSIGYGTIFHTFDGEPSSQNVNVAPQAGMSLRDYFAAHAPPYPFLLPQIDPRTGAWRQVADPIARWNFAYADAMLAERAK